MRGNMSPGHGQQQMQLPKVVIVWDKSQVKKGQKRT